MALDGKTKLLRNIAILAFVAATAIILIGGYYARDKVPPIPGRVLSGKQILTDRQAIMRGQDVYQSHGLMDHGSVWGHGTLRGMDFSADTLHRVALSARDYRADAANPRGAYDRLAPARKAAVDQQVIAEIKSSQVRGEDLELTPALAYALEQNREYWDQEFGRGDTGVGFLPNSVARAEDRRDIADFFFWTAWAAGALRPGETSTYTVNWPYDPAVGNVATSPAFVWSLLSILALFAVLGLIVYVVHRYRFFFGEAKAAGIAISLLETPVSPSQRATAKFFLIAALLFVVQILNGGLLANYTVRPGQFYIQTVGNLYPYSWAKTWHVQLAILWIAVAWIGTALYIGPLIVRREPRGQRTLVNLLFGAALLVIVGSLTGEVLSIKGLLGDWWFWLGHQGWEYLELGRLWQILLLAGLVFWLVIVYRTIVPALRRPKDRPASEEESDRRSLIAFYVISAVLIVVFFAFGLLYGRGTHLTVAEYWRWFVVHIWVEGIFEFFGVAVISLFLVFMGLVEARSALRVAYLTASLVLFYGIPGVAHHYFWVGGPSYWLALGGVFSSLEPVPLILLVVRAWMEYRSIRQQGREFPYKWPLYFLVASSVWNFVGAAIFGFIMNLPIVNYYTHSTYLTANHAHTALFGVYGMLAVSLLLFSWRGLVETRFWNERLLKISFWGLNGGLFLMFSTSLLPIALLHVQAVFEHGFHFARSPEFWQLPNVRWLAEWRIVPDLIIIVVGAFPLLWFLLSTFPRLRRSA